MLLGFKRRFAPFVLDGSKTHTIRTKRKNLFQVGKVCDCYVDSRQKTMRLLGRWPCVKVEEIAIGLFGRMTINGIRLSEDERNAFAWRDGFRSRSRNESFDEMLEYWKGSLPFVGHVIHWDYSQPVQPAVVMVSGKRSRSRKTQAALKEMAQAAIRYMKQRDPNGPGCF